MTSNWSLGLTRSLIIFLYEMVDIMVYFFGKVSVFHWRLKEATKSVSWVYWWISEKFNIQSLYQVLKQKRMLKLVKMCIPWFLFITLTSWSITIVSKKSSLCCQGDDKASLLATNVPMGIRGDSQILRSRLVRLLRNNGECYDGNVVSLGRGSKIIFLLHGNSR